MSDHLWLIDVDPILVISHIGAMLFGILTGIAVIHLRPVRTVITHEELDHMPTHEHDPPTHKPTFRTRVHDRIRGKGPTPGAIALFLILGGLVTLGFAIQQSAFQQESKDRDACVERWGVGMVSTAETRFKATKNLETAQKARDDALDSIILAVISAEDLPEQEARRAFNSALSAFAKAKADLVVVEGNVDKTRRNNVYPKLQCDDEGLQEDEVPPDAS